MRTNMKYAVLGVVTVATLALAAAGCGKGYKFVTDVKIKTYQENNEAFGQIKLVFNTGNIQLPSFDLPIANPLNPGESYGRVAMRPALGGGTEIQVDANLSKIPGVPGFGDGTLPNGKQIPLGGVDPEDVMSFPVANTGVRIYVLFGDGVAMVGAAIPIAQFKKLVDMVGSFDLFIPFNIEGVRGTAGIFSGKEDGQSGAAFFVDAGKFLEDVLVQQALAQAGVRTSDVKELEFQARSPGYSKEQKIYKQLGKWHESKAKMSVK